MSTLVEITLQLVVTVKRIRTTIDLFFILQDGPAGEDFVDIHPKYKVDKENKSGFGIHRAALTFKYNTKIYTRLDFRDYPFDQQAVEIQIKLLSVRLPGVKSGTRPKVCDPERWRAKDNGHQVLSDGKVFLIYFY